MQDAKARHETPSVRAALSRLRGALLRLVVRDGPLVTACGALIALGVVLRSIDVAFPRVMTWDEHHFVVNARNYLSHAHDWNDHPPFGKLLIAAGMVIYGDTSLGWRFAPVALGIAAIPLAYCIAALHFRDRRAGYLAAAFVAGDGFLIAYSRTALLDGMLATTSLAVVFFALRARSWRAVALAAVAIGCAANIKLSGAFLLLPVAARCLFLRDRLFALAALALSFVTYVALFVWGLALSGEPHGIADAWRATNAIVAHHAALTQFTHPLTSHWYTWFLPTRPVTMRYDVVAPGVVRAMTSLGNPLLWWASDAALLAGLGFAAYAGVRYARERRQAIHVGRTARASTGLVAFAVAMLLPWMFGNRDSYIYHYLPTYAVLLVLLGGNVSVIYRRRRAHVLAFVLAVGLVSVYYAPAWSQLPISAAGFRARMPFKMWR